MTALENVELPMILLGKHDDKERKKKATALLKRVGLGDRLDHLPSELSGGEQQRVAIARALANNPKILLADEPTGNLDPSTASEVFSMLVKLVKDQGIAAIIATHNHTLAQSMDRFVELKDGKLHESRS